MSDDPQAASTPDPPAAFVPAAFVSTPRSESAASLQSSSGGGPVVALAGRPEVAVGGAFAGGLLLALILKRLAR